ncbi:DUF3613 domain-containing protein [Glaciimonas immobilis]|uniref:DUF3613 domain-containing protein n=1 Tax=Glaciimonas immobilis TaxID=728004 RepID=A0A840RK99_9BURK|nr:DUF3613 domain-containing protein [Glaciimonas immobilis]KAF3998828.1 DUF3613 domain-containing protein [Glaciimonas immobilis]MBB5198213.1 hypothetical protein [Glaciimonas immobilis]
MKTPQHLFFADGLTRNATLFIALALAFLPALHAQNNAPVTGGMTQVKPVTPTAAPTRSVPAVTPSTVSALQAPSSPATVAATAPTAVQEQPIARIRVGDVTRSLLQAQVDGRVAAPRLPMLGATADASYDRYLNSFTHPLPEFFETKVAKNAAN